MNLNSHTFGKDFDNDVKLAAASLYYLFTYLFGSSSRKKENKYMGFL